MKLYNNVTNRSMAFAAGFLALATNLSCGRIERAPHYNDPKDYGQTTVIKDDHDETGSIDLMSDGPDDAMTKPTIVPATNPDTVIASVLFRGAVDPDSFRFLTSGGTRINPWKITGSSYARSYFDGPQNIQLFGKQTYGDEVSGVSNLIQEGVSSTADLGVHFGGESESGQQILERMVGNDDVEGACPTAAVCIRSMHWIPTNGATRTYCYSDPETGESTLFPYAPAPNFPAKDAELASGSYGPYLVSAYPGKVDCSKREKPVEATGKQEVFVRFQFNANPKMDYRVRTSNLVEPDYSVRVLVEKYRTNTQRDMKPYLDDLTRLQAESEFFINSKEQMLVKVIKTSHKTINFPGDNSIWGRLVRGYNAVSPVVGITMNVHAELCVDYTTDQQRDECDIAAATTNSGVEVNNP